MSGKYNSPYVEGGSYSRAVELLGKIGVSGEAHLDIGCGYGAINRIIAEKYGLHYIGVDCDKDALGALNEKGVETHCYSLGQASADEDYEYFKSVLNGRKLASATALDILEHLAEPEKTVDALHRLCLEYSAPLIVSVPNVSHKDIAFKLLAGDFDYTETGLLDKTHISLFTEKRLSSMMNGAGFAEAVRNDACTDISEQHFPQEHSFLAEGTAIYQTLDAIKSMVDPYADVYQFIRAYKPVHKEPGSSKAETVKVQTKPFLSVVMRTQGRRPEALREALLCLSTQTDTDYEILIIGHKLQEAQRELVFQIIAETPQWQNEKIRFIAVNHGNWTTPLNIGFEQAHGQYISVYNDGDTVFSNWVKEFKECYVSNPGSILHAYIVTQDWETLENGALRAASTPSAYYCRDFNYLSQLEDNYCPPIGLAFPSFAFKRLNIRFDESLTTAEDWDFLMRIAAVCGVADIKTPTGIYRRWPNGERSASVHSNEEWMQNGVTVREKLRKLPVIIPSGAVALSYLSQNNTSVQAYYAPTESTGETEAQIYRSSSAEVKEMHPSSIENMQKFIDGYVRSGTRLLDVGSQEVEGQQESSYRRLFAGKDVEYVGCDISAGHNVDVVLKSPYDWKNIKSNSFDYVISGQMLEHVEFPWLSFLEIHRVLKPGGICCIIAPSAGPMHQFPLDCYRYYPDGMVALANSAHLHVLDVYTNWDYEKYPYLDPVWKDTVLVAQKSKNSLWNLKADIKRKLFHLVSSQSLRPVSRASANLGGSGAQPHKIRLVQPVDEKGQILSSSEQRELFGRIKEGQKLNDLEEFFLQGEHRPIHKCLNYFEVYDRHLSHYRGKPVTIVEIGVGEGGSLQMWKNYFGPQARIIGIDINVSSKKYEEPGIEIFIGNQENVEFWRRFKNEVPTVDILIDDGGHSANQQRTSFAEMFQHLSSDGIYVCEDLHTSYWPDFGGGYLREGSFIEYSKGLVDSLNAFHSESDYLKPDYLSRHIKGLHFYDSIVIVEKGSREAPPEILRI